MSKWTCCWEPQLPQTPSTAQHAFSPDLLTCPAAVQGAAEAVRLSWPLLCFLPVQEQSYPSTALRYQLPAICRQLLPAICMYSALACMASIL